MGGAILVLLAIPFINTSDVRNTTYRPIFKLCFWLFLADFILLTWVGQKPVKDSFILLGQICTLYYFMFFLVLIPLIGSIESALAHHKATAGNKLTHNFYKINVWKSFFIKNFSKYLFAILAI